MRIALFSETFLPQRNGVALIVDRLVRHLARDGHELLLVVPVSWRPRGDAPVPDGVTLLRVAGAPLPKYPDLTIGIPLAPRILDAVHHFRPDVIHLVTEFTMGLTGLRAAWELRVPTVASFHTNVPGALPYYGFPWATDWCWAYLRWFHNRAGVSLCPSEANRAELLARGFRNVRIWPRGVDTERFSPTRRSAAVRARLGSNDGFHLLYVGRVTPEKELPILFDAFRRVSAAGLPQSVHLTIAGDGAYTARTQANAPREVTFTGYLEGDALDEVYAAADAFVFPSRVETLGNVVLEAMAAGLPVIGVNQGGTIENVRDGVNGYLCEPGNAVSVADAILRLATDAGLRSQLSRNARAWAEARTWEAAFQPLVATYEEMAGR
jgi:phosphatidylinositol alpha 1,6-mannosyltransferase